MKSRSKPITAPRAEEKALGIQSSGEYDDSYEYQPIITLQAQIN